MPSVKAYNPNQLSKIISFSVQCLLILSTIILCINNFNLYFRLFFAGEVIPNDLSSLEEIPTKTDAEVKGCGRGYCGGRHDSMGHCAKYGAYTIFCCTLTKIIHFSLVQV